MISRFSWRPSCLVSRFSWRHAALLCWLAALQSTLFWRASCFASWFASRPSRRCCACSVAKAAPDNASNTPAIRAAVRLMCRVGFESIIYMLLWLGWYRRTPARLPRRPGMRPLFCRLGRCGSLNTDRGPVQSHIGDGMISCGRRSTSGEPTSAQGWSIKSRAVLGRSPDKPDCRQRS